MTTMQLSGDVSNSIQILEQSSPVTSERQAPLDLSILLQEMARSNASDLHLVAGTPPRLRVNGSLFPIAEMGNASAEETEAIFLAVTGGKKQLLAELWKQKGMDFAYEVPGLGRFRVNATIQQSTVNLTLRRIHATVPDFEELGIPEVCRELANKKKGLILVTGPVNSGKSTTMAAFIEHINQTSSRRILTIEDPVEYVYSPGKGLITQRELGSDVLAFADGLRSALRQDPDVILVGELRDAETVSACLTAAETGHLVMSTLHTPNAYQAVDRLVDVFPAGQQRLIASRLASLLEAILYQTLVPTIDGNSKVLAIEIMLATPAIRALIREEKTHQIPNTIHTSGSSGMQTMDQALSDLYKRKLISKEELFLRCINPTQVLRQLGLEL